MTIDEAIKILEKAVGPDYQELKPHFKRATKLGIEALKRFKLFRQGHFNIHLDPLPGETEGTEK